MKCDICGAREATLHIRQLKEDEETLICLCEECASSKGVSLKSSSFSLRDLLSGLVEAKAASLQQQKSCPTCGLTISQFEKKPRAGCCVCYSIFSQEIRKVINRRYGKVRHQGRYPKRLHAFKSYLIDVEQLKRKLAAAVKKEDYEAAARIRDRIRQIHCRGYRHTSA